VSTQGATPDSDYHSARIERRQALERNRVAMLEVTRFVHDAHAARAKPPHELEASQQDRLDRLAEDFCLDARPNQRTPRRVTSQSEPSAGADCDAGAAIALPNSRDVVSSRFRQRQR
jgi:hypothetical protein